MRRYPKPPPDLGQIRVTDCKLTPADRQLLRDLHKLLLQRDPRTIASSAKLLHAYYRDLDRTERTPRKLLYYHMGWMHAGMMWFADTLANAGIIMVTLDEIRQQATAHGSRTPTTKVTH
jgi:hypothetical protein